MIVPAAEFFSPDALAEMRRLLRAAGDFEIAAIGRVGGSGLVVEVLHVGTGHQSAAPATVGRVRAGEWLIHSHPSGPITPSESDLDFCTLADLAGAGVAVVDRDAHHVAIVMRPASPPREGFLSRLSWEWRRAFSPSTPEILTLPAAPSPRRRSGWLDPVRQRQGRGPPRGGWLDRR